MFHCEIRLKFQAHTINTASKKSERQRETALAHTHTDKGWKAESYRKSSIDIQWQDDGIAMMMTMTITERENTYTHRLWVNVFLNTLFPRWILRRCVAVTRKSVLVCVDSRNVCCYFKSNEKRDYDDRLRVRSRLIILSTALSLPLFHPCLLLALWTVTNKSLMMFIFH